MEKQWQSRDGNIYIAARNGSGWSIARSWQEDGGTVFRPQRHVFDTREKAQGELDRRALLYGWTEADAVRTYPPEELRITGGAEDGFWQITDRDGQQVCPETYEEFEDARDAFMRLTGRNRRKVRKAVGDLTLREVAQICADSTRLCEAAAAGWDGSGCACGCPLADTGVCFRIAIGMKDDLDRQVEVAVDGR